MRTIVPVGGTCDNHKVHGGAVERLVRPLPAARAARTWRHGGRLSRRPRRARQRLAHARHQAHPAQPLARPALRQDADLGGAGLGALAPLCDRPDVRARLRRGRALHRDGVRRRGQPADGAAQLRRRRSPSAAGARLLHRQGGGGGAALRALARRRRWPVARHRAPRRQPVQRDDLALGRRQGARLRHRQGRAAHPRRSHDHRRAQGQDQLHVARAGERGSRRRALRHLLARHRLLGSADLDAAVQGRERPALAAPDSRDDTAAAVGAGAVGRSRDRRHRRQDAGASAGRALRELSGGGRRARAHHRARARRRERAGALPRGAEHRCGGGPAAVDDWAGGFRSGARRRAASTPWCWCRARRSTIDRRR